MTPPSPSALLLFVICSSAITFEATISDRLLSLLLWIKWIVGRRLLSILSTNKSFLSSEKNIPSLNACFPPPFFPSGQAVSPILFYRFQALHLKKFWSVFIFVFFRFLLSLLGLCLHFACHILCSFLIISFELISAFCKILDSSNISWNITILFLSCYLLNFSASVYLCLKWCGCLCSCRYHSESKVSLLLISGSLAIFLLWSSPFWILMVWS